MDQLTRTPLERIISRVLVGDYNVKIFLRAKLIDLFPTQAVISDMLNLHKGCEKDFLVLSFHLSVYSIMIYPSGHGTSNILYSR